MYLATKQPILRKFNDRLHNLNMTFRKVHHFLSCKALFKKEQKQKKANDLQRFQENLKVKKLMNLLGDKKQKGE